MNRGGVPRRLLHEKKNIKFLRGTKKKRFARGTTNKLGTTVVDTPTVLQAPRFWIYRRRIESESCKLSINVEIIIIVRSSRGTALMSQT